MKPNSLLYLFYLRSKLLLFSILLFSQVLIFSQDLTGRLKELGEKTDSKADWSKKPFERKVFIENKEQYASELPPSKNNFSYCIDNGAKIFFYRNEVLFYFTKSLLTKEKMEEKEDPDEERSREMELQKKETQFISMKWLNANSDAVIEAGDEQTSDYGYVICKNVPKNYTAHCKGYGKLKIKNLYNGIDVEYFFTEKEGFKYNLYIAAGADVSQIQQYYDGAENIKLKEDCIVIKTIQGDIIDHAPISFSTDNKEQKTACRFVLNKNSVSFKLEKNPLLANENGAITFNQPMTIDPWVTVPTMAAAPVDNGVDQYGNSYITSPGYILEKYSPTGILIASTDIMGGSAPYYGDMLTDSRGYCFFNTMGSHPRGDASAVDSAGNFLWDSFGINECWRFVLNECNHQVLSLTGYRHSATGFARINTSTGALTGYTQSGTCCQDPHCGVIDYNGDVYTIASDYQAGVSLIYKWTPSNTIAATYPAIGNWGYGYFVTPNYYTKVGNLGQGLNGMTILGNNLYIYDGAALFKVNKTNGTILTQVSVPGGLNKQNGGIYITSCGKIFVGSSTGVYMYDMNFNQVDFKATTGAVYDLAFNSFNQTISACGPGHVTELAFVIPPCVFQTQQVVQPSCGVLADGYIKLNLSGGVPDYTYTWSKNNIALAQTTDSIGNLTPGTYKCVYTDNKCPIPNIDSIQIVVPSITTSAAFTFNDVCSPSSMLLVDSSSVNHGSINSWSWKFGDGNSAILQSPAHTYAADGTYNVSLLVVTTDGCKDSNSKNVTVYPKPLAGFTFTNKCNGTAVPFNSTSTINTPGVIAQWNWNFGDNTIASGSSTSHTYSSPGNYNVTLIINSSNFCADTIMQQVKVFNNPAAGFMHSDVCFRDTMRFANTSTVSLPAVIAGYLWDFGDNGPTSILQSPVHDYTSHGNYNVTLVATTADGCSNALAVPVNVFDAPSSAFTFSNTCLFDSAVFVNASANPTMGAISNWSWNFGDTSPLNTTVGNPHHLYASPGNYQVTLITHSSNLGCPDTLKRPITVFPMPAAKFVFRNVCLNQPMNFFDSSTVSLGSIAGWSWSFGDGTALVTLQNPNHTYILPGTYTVSLIVTTSDGCKDTVTKNVVVHALPVAQFNTASVCSGTAVHFSDVSHILATDTIQSWRWNFGDGTVFNTNQNSTHLYAAPGSFVVQLFIVSKFGCVDSTIKTSVVNPNPVVNFKGDDTVGCEPVCVNFQNLSSVLTGTNTAWLWTFGSGNGSSILKDPSHCYDNDSVFSAMFFNVTLKATSDSGCVTTLSKNNYIAVYPNPNAVFTVLPESASIINPIISVRDLSTGTDFWHWNFGNGDTTSVHNPSPHTFADTGTYIITLKASTLFNCIDSTFQTIVIEPDFLFYIPNSFTPNDDGINDVFSGKGIFIKDYEMMIFDRWGNLIFYTNDINKGWDGTANHGTETSQRDVYVYSIKITDYNKLKHSYKGSVTLVR